MIENDDLLIIFMNRNDFDVMVKWLNDQRILEFYEELPSNFDEVEKKYGPRIEGKHYVTLCIVEYNNQPLGYIQYYKIQEDGLKKYEFTSKSKYLWNRPIYCRN